MAFKALIKIVVLVGLLGILAGYGNAQLSCSTVFVCQHVDSVFYGTCDPTPPATIHDCDELIPFTAYCPVKTDACHPKSECPSCNRASHPIDLATGNTDITQLDLRLPGLGGGLTLQRTWNSIWPENEGAYRQGLFGTNWRSTYEERVFTGNDGYMKYSRGDGSFWSFGYSTTITNPNAYPVFAVNSPANEGTTLVQDPALWIMKFKNGEVRTFDRNTGYLLTITDRNGNVTQITYDPSYRLTGVTDAASRHLYFSYASPTSYLISSVTSDFGVSLSYTYDGLSRLTQVTQPDNTTVTYHYDNNSDITSVTDSNNKVLESHTYDNQGRGLTGSRAGGIESVTITYPQPPTPPPLAF